MLAARELSRRFSRLVGHPWFWVTLIVAIAGLSLGRAFLTRLPPELPVGGEFPPFLLTDQHGEPFGSEQVKGRVWLVAVFSPSTPEGDQLGDTLKTIQHRAHNLGASFHLVCITNDARVDSPGALDVFIRQVHGSPRMWTFLTGNAADVDALLTQVATSSGGGTNGALLIDAAMRIRAHYDLGESGVIERILRDIGMVANRGG
jgi:protein SCO1/2